MICGAVNAMEIIEDGFQKMSFGLLGSAFSKPQKKINRVVVSVPVVPVSLITAPGILAGNNQALSSAYLSAGPVNTSRSEASVALYFKNNAASFSFRSSTNSRIQSENSVVDVLYGNKDLGQFGVEGNLKFSVGAEESNKLGKTKRKKSKKIKFSRL